MNKQQLQHYGAHVQETNHVWPKWNKTITSYDSDTPHADTAHLHERVYNISIGSDGLHALLDDLRGAHRIAEWFRHNPQMMEHYDKWTVWNQLKL